MSMYSLEGRKPLVSEGAYVSPSAEVIGDVRIGTGCWVGPGAVLRGDFNRITIGEHTAIEENCVVHAQPETACRIGDSVTIGHGAIIHGALVDDFATIGMGVVVGMQARIGRWAIIGEGAVVKSRQEIPPETIAAGVPAEVIRELDPERKAFWSNGKRLYRDLARRYLEGLRPL